MYILDSDVFSLYYVRENPSPPLKERIESTPNERLYITPINVEESFKGALKLIQRYNEATGDDKARLTFAYDLLLKIKLALSKPQMLPFDDLAYAEYVKIPKGIEKIVKSRDCRIAAIAVSRNFTVVTINERDYERIREAIPVKHVNWAKRDTEEPAEAAALEPPPA